MTGKLQSFVIFLLVLISLAPPRARAHGELLIRIAAATREIATNPVPDLYLKRGELYREDQNWEAAEADYRRAAELGLASDAIDLCRGQLFADRNQLDRAREVLTQLIQHNPGNGKALISRAHIFVRSQQSRAAVADFQAAFDCGAELDSLSWLEWAQMLVAEKRAEDALAVLDRGMRRIGGISTLQVYAVDLELARANTSAALSRLQTIIESADRKERWFVRRGEIQLRAGDRLGARESYESALVAIKRLPKILQASPAMLSLKSQIGAALAGMDESPAISKVGAQ